MSSLEKYQVDGCWFMLVIHADLPLWVSGGWLIGVSWSQQQLGAHCSTLVSGWCEPPAFQFCCSFARHFSRENAHPGCSFMLTPLFRGCFMLRGWNRSTSLEPSRRKNMPHVLPMERNWWGFFVAGESQVVKYAVFLSRAKVWNCKTLETLHCFLHIKNFNNKNDQKIAISKK